MRLAYLLVILCGGLSGCYAPDIQEGGFACNPDPNANQPQCPDGFACTGQCTTKVNPGFLCCVKLSPTVGVTPTRCLDDLSAQKKINDKKAAWQPSTMSPTWTVCPDDIYEPNEGTGSTCSQHLPSALNTTAGGFKGAICPIGPARTTGVHDVDYFQLDLSQGLPQTFNIVANLTYTAAKGDLDIGIFNKTGSLLGWDTENRDNACAAAVSQSPGTYYVVVVGAGGVDSNDYTINVTQNTTNTVCPR